MERITVIVHGFGKGQLVGFDEETQLWEIAMNDGAGAYCGVDEFTFILD